MAAEALAATVAARAAGPGACAVCDGPLQPYRHDWLYRCGRCHTLRGLLEIDIPETPDEGRIDEAAREAGLATLRERNNAVLLDAIAALHPPGRRLLDVGSGPGFLLRQAAARGFHAEGVEPDANVLAACRADGLVVRQGYFPDALAPGARYDVIVFNDVLEHVPDVAAALQASWRSLAPGGILCLNCPDRRGLFFRTAAALDRLGLAGPYDRLWQRGLPSPHVWYFTLDGLAAAGRRAGFEPLREVRLDTVELGGLWRRIRYVKGGSLLVGLAAWIFAAATLPLSRLLPADSAACLLRKPAG
ncbi:class I SAM-dependent methyltransferase [Phenylobacterium sp.]|jgi:SAM-dependent methyltransferase|uniref:class I SAM-dependent methyltransferase n=1 Tax=Phenylobacterium sp. TaxID=1871053 RepID=UPI002F93FC59